MKSVGDIYPYIRGHRVTTDSRHILPGDVFVALRGEHYDGNRFAASALQKGASLAIIDNPEYQIPGCELVSDCLLFLQQLAHFHRRRLGVPIIGITGTNGKTTTKELCHAVLSMKFNTVATEGNFNNHIGVPLTLLRMDESTEFGIVEMGANHPGEIRELCDIADPDMGIVTNIGQAHLEGFGSYENIVLTKKALYDHVFCKDGEVFVNAGDSLLLQLSEGHRRLTYGMAGDFIRGEVRQTVPYMVFSLLLPKGQLYVKTRMVGGYNFENAMAATALGLHFGIDPLKIREAIEDYRPSNLRSQLLKTDANTVILDAYNANPSSMRVAIDNFMEMPGRHKVLILGEMRELGQSSSDAHREIVRLAGEGHFDLIFLIGDNFKHCSDGCDSIAWFPDTEAFISELRKNPLTDAFILVKGSRGNRLERVVEYL